MKQVQNAITEILKMLFRFKIIYLLYKCYNIMLQIFSLILTQIIELAYSFIEKKYHRYFYYILFFYDIELSRDLKFKC